jgi:hypothetical protein
MGSLPHNGLGGPLAACGPATGAAASNVGERRKRRKLPVIERPQSAPIYNNVVTERTLLLQGGDLTKTVITIAGDEEREEEEEAVPGLPGAPQPRKCVREDSRVGAMKKFHQLSKSSSRIPTRQQYSGVREVATLISHILFLLIKCRKATGYSIPYSSAFSAL